MSPRESANKAGLFLAGHPALDFLNTLEKPEAGIVDLFQSDVDVRRWLKREGFEVPHPGKTESLDLLSPARTLRENIRSLVESRKGLKSGDPSVLNRFLAVGHSYPQLLWQRSHYPRIETMRVQDSAESILAPVAEAAADLLAMQNFDLVKQCEDEDCVRWFLDQTKSHRRRWCSMELCGNRHKVAAYRARRRDE